MTDDRTLAEIGQDDTNQLEQANKDGDLFEFLDRKQAIEFQMHCVRDALAKLGMPNSDIMAIKMIDSLLESKRIRIESRAYHEPEDIWKTGVYIYKLKEDGENIDELAYFVSNLKECKPGPFSRNRIHKWGIRTNVPPDGATKMISIPKVLENPNVSAAAGTPGTA